MVYHPVLATHPSSIADLIRSHLEKSPNSTITDTERTLCEELGATEVQLCNSSYVHVHGRTLLRNAVETVKHISIWLPIQPASEAGDHSQRGFVTTSGQGRDADVPAAKASDLERCIADVARLESNRADTWMGYLLKERLPSLGFTAEESKEIIRRMETEGILTIQQRPNPKNPSHPATFVRLNRSHPKVIAALAHTSTGRQRFPLGRIEGEPLSETIIRERR